MISGGTGTNPFYRYTTEFPLNILNVGAGIGREVLVLLDTHCVALPAGQSDVLDLDLLEDLGVGRVGVGQAGSVREDIGNCDLDLVKVVQDVQLGQVQRGVVVDRLGVAAEDEIEPAAATTTAGSNAEFPAD